MTSEYAIFD